MISTKNINEARKQIDRLASKCGKNNDGSNEIGWKIIVLSQDDEFNRKIIDNKKVDMIVLNDDLIVKDYMKQRNSGLNEYLCKALSKNEIVVGIEIDKVIAKEDVEKAKSLARLKQNIELCKRNSTKIVLISGKSKGMLMSLMLSLGSSTSQAKNAISDLGKFF